MDKGQKQGETQREERIRQIVDVTAALYDRDGYDAVTFSTIGRGLDFSRINLYNYFRGKEDIFLLILRRDIEAMVQDAEASFTAPENDLTVFAADWGALMMRHQRMMSLFGIVNTILLRGQAMRHMWHFAPLSMRNFCGWGRSSAGYCRGWMRDFRRLLSILKTATP